MSCILQHCTVLCTIQVSTAVIYCPVQCTVFVLCTVLQCTIYCTVQCTALFTLLHCALCNFMLSAGCSSSACRLQQLCLATESAGLQPPCIQAGKNKTILRKWKIRKTKRTKTPFPPTPSNIMVQIICSKYMLSLFMCPLYR